MFKKSKNAPTELEPVDTMPVDIELPAPEAVITSAAKAEPREPVVDSDAIKAARKNGRSEAFVAVDAMLSAYDARMSDGVTLGLTEFRKLKSAIAALNS